MFANVNDFRENNFFPVFDCILENSLKNIFQCLGQRKMKKKKKKSETIANANPPPQSTVNPPQTTIKKTHKPTITAKPTQLNPLQTHCNPPQIITIIWATSVLGARARPSLSLPRSPVTQSGEREIGEAQIHLRRREAHREAQIRLRPPRSPVIYNPSPPSQDHVGCNHSEKKTRREGDCCEGDKGHGGWLGENKALLGERESWEIE